LCASTNVNTKLVTARHLLKPCIETSPSKAELEDTAPKPWWERFLEHTGVDVIACPSCTTGRMQRQRPLFALEIAMVAERIATPTADTS
jgi:hypothetical protein